MATKLREPRLRGEQIVEARVAPVLADVVADRQQLAVVVVEEFVIDLGEFDAARGELSKLRKPMRRPLGRRFACASQSVEPSPVPAGAGLRHPRNPYER